MSNFTKDHFKSFACFFVCMLISIIITGVSSLPVIDVIGILIFSLILSVFGGFVVDICNGN